MERFPTEDGYFMLAIGRNLAIGKGFSTADGTIETNGTQPLTTFVWALCFWLSGGDRAGGVALVLVYEVVMSMLAAWALYRFGLRLLGERVYARSVSLLAAALWFASPLTILHTMNCLETGTYAFFVLLCAHALIDLSELPNRGWELRRVLTFGALLGATFWARNDAVFLIGATCVCYLLPVLRDAAALRVRLARTLAFGALSVLVASPWLIYNYVGFGSIMPVSGRAERLTGHLGGNVLSVLTTLLEYASLALPIPQTLQDSLGFALLGVLVLLALIAILVRIYKQATPQERTIIAWVACYGLLLSGYYGIFFGAQWFVQRYLFPLAAFFAVLLGVILFAVRDRLSGKLREAFMPIMTALMVGACIAVNVRNQVMNRDHPHFQVIRWVQEHVPEDVWVGAIQTGTLGFFHDRTLNFDGKVNPAAYQAAIEGRRPAYVAGTNVQYLVDWVGIVTWMKDPPIAAAFQVLVEDNEHNLGVLGRKPR
ncbi:MAG TPA: hypothetical protein VJV78_48845 [Polyangiales bacterium]|nr:hypothetical protein [Polyangiales bacterium]